MTVIFLGLMYSEKSLKDAKANSRRGLQMAPHNFQTTLIKGFEQLEDVDVTVLNISPVGSYPHNYKKIFIDREVWGRNNIQIGYINLPVIKRFEQEIKIGKEIEKLIKKYGEDDVSIIAYHTYEPFINAIKAVKKRHASVKSCLIVTDCIPGREDMEKYMTASAVRAGNRIVKSAKYVDSFALLTKHHADALEIVDKPYIITECIADVAQKECSVNTDIKRICLYTGSLDVQFGICELADCFALLKDAELWICGRGNGQEYIEKMAKEHNNIKYFGFLSPNELQGLRDKCDFLINPRRPTGTYTKYSFPSKTAEYMMSGKPTIMYKLEGIPDEYDAYLNYLNGNDVSDIKAELSRIFSHDYATLVEKASKGRRFMAENKNAKKQASRIIDVVSKA